MNQTTDSIAAIIKNKSDEKLRSEISEQLKPFRQLLIYASRAENEIEIERENKNCIMNAHAALDALEKHAFKLNCESRQDRAIQDFLAKVENIGSEIEELKRAVGT